MIVTTDMYVIKIACGKIIILAFLDWFCSESSSVSTTVSKNVFVGNQRTSVRLESVEWDALEEICRDKGCRLRDICLEVSGNRDQGRSFTSALRVYCLTYFRKKSQLVTQGNPQSGQA